MAIIFINCSPINSLNKEPYTTLAKKYKRIISIHAPRTGSDSPATETP